MTNPRARFVDEMLAAGRGVLALVIGDRKAPGYFDLSEHGLVGSFIGLLGITFVSAVLPLFVPGMGENYSIARSAGIAVVLFAFQVGFAAIALRQLKRLDGLRPYLVADNWASVYISAGQLLLTFAGIQGEFAFFALSILVIVVEVNIGRLIVTLSPLQIAIFMIAQLVGVTIALLVAGALFPSPEVQQAISSLQP